MENVGHQSGPRLVEGHKKNYNGRRRKGNNDPLKVVYISNPMKVKTSASRFRSLVQELTGKNSDMTRYNIEVRTSHNATSDFHVIDCHEDNGQVMLAKETSDHRQYLGFSSDDTVVFSGSLSKSVDNHVLRSPMDYDQFLGVSSSFSELSQLDVLGSYDEF